MNTICRCSNPNQLFMIFTNESKQLSENATFNVNSLIFVANMINNDPSNLNLSYHASNLSLVQSYTMNNIDLSSLLKKLSIEQSDSSRCFCRNGQLVLRVGILNARSINFIFYKTNDPDIRKLNYRVYELLAQSIFKTIAQTLKLSYVEYVEPNNKIGQMNSSGQYDGLIGMLTRNVRRYTFVFQLNEMKFKKNIFTIKKRRSISQWQRFR